MTSQERKVRSFVIFSDRFRQRSSIESDDRVGFSRPTYAREADLGTTPSASPTDHSPVHCANAWTKDTIDNARAAETWAEIPHNANGLDTGFKPTDAWLHGCRVQNRITM